MKHTHWLFESMDQVRRLQASALDGFGLGPCESAYQAVHERPGLRLRCYGSGEAGAAPLLIVPAPIKRPYIWDLTPERSVVRRALEHGLGVYLVEWTAPPGGAAQPGLADYSGPMLGECVDAAAQREGSDKVILAGHSLGGVFTALYSAYRPSRVAALALIDVPLHFAEASGAFRPLLQFDFAEEAANASTERIPGSLLSMISAGAAPGTFCTSRYVDHLASLGSRQRMDTHWRVERWTMDECPVSRKLFDDVIVELYRRDSFMRGKIDIGGNRLHPRDISAPLLAVYQPSSALIPSGSVRAFFLAAGSTDKELLAYPGDTGVALQHIGPLVGDNAHLDLWPRVFAWIERFTGRPGPARRPAPEQCAYWRH